MDPDPVKPRGARGGSPKSAGMMAREVIKASFRAAEIADVFKPWEHARGILLGVSGGPDSVALMLLAAEWTRGRAAAAPPLYVATVDHGLRKESHAEAAIVAGWAAALALPHTILVWEGIKPRSRVQERARDARYALLTSCAAEIGADHIMTGHHADDQAETILFRLLRGSGISGLSGMESSSNRNGITLARPLLGRTKGELIAFCESKMHPFIKDPSNLDPAYARTRVRQLSGLLAEEGLDRKALLRLGRRAARADAALVEHTRAVTAALKVQREPGLYSANISALTAESEEILLRFLADELKLIRGDKPIRFDHLEALARGLHQALRRGSDFRGTLGGALLRLHGGHCLVIRQEGTRHRGQQNLPEIVGARS